ncbi:hypothetical protein ACQ4PT_017923 [Festuca glaucescens]
MASLDRGKGKECEALSPRAARARLEEQLGKLDITEEEATPLVIDDREEEMQQKWMLVGKVLYCNVFHIQTISNAMRPAWGNSKGLLFRYVGKNMFVAEFATQHDRDHVWEGLPWHVSNNDVVSSEFEDCMTPSELKFDRLQLWARIMNLPFNLREKKWWLLIAHQIDKGAKDVQFDHVGGTRDSNGNLPFGKDLIAPNEGRRTSYIEGSTGEPSFTHQNKADTRTSSTRAEVGPEATSLLKKQNINKRKMGTQTKVYRQVQPPPLLLIAPGVNLLDDSSSAPLSDIPGASEVDGHGGVEPDLKKKKPTPTSSENMAVTAGQPCLDQ